MCRPLRFCKGLVKGQVNLALGLSVSLIFFLFSPGQSKRGRFYKRNDDAFKNSDSGISSQLFLDNAFKLNSLSDFYHGHMTLLRGKK